MANNLSRNTIKILPQHPSHVLSGMGCHLVLEQEGELAALSNTVEVAVHLVVFATQSATLFSLGKILEAIGCPSFCLLMFFHMPGQLGGDVSHKVAARTKTVVMPSHPEFTVLVWTETLQRIVSKLVSHIHQIIVGVDVVQAVGFCFARGFAHILAVPKETVEVEFVGILAVRCQAGIILLELEKSRFDLRLGVLQGSRCQG